MPGCLTSRARQREKKEIRYDRRVPDQKNDISCRLEWAAHHEVECRLQISKDLVVTRGDGASHAIGELTQHWPRDSVLRKDTLETDDRVLRGTDTCRFDNPQVLAVTRGSSSVSRAVGDTNVRRAESETQMKKNKKICCSVSKNISVHRTVQTALSSPIQERDLPVFRHQTHSKVRFNPPKMPGRRMP